MLYTDDVQIDWEEASASDSNKLQQTVPMAPGLSSDDCHIA